MCWNTHVYMKMIECMSVWEYVYIHTYIHKCVVNMYEYVYCTIYVCIIRSMQVCTCWSVHMYRVHTCVGVCMCVHVHMYMYTDENGVYTIIWLYRLEYIYRWVCVHMWRVSCAVHPCTLGLHVQCCATWSPRHCHSGSVGTWWICGPGLSWVLLTSGRRHSNKKPYL